MDYLPLVGPEHHQLNRDGQADFLALTEVAFTFFRVNLVKSMEDLYNTLFESLSQDKQMLTAVSCNLFDHLEELLCNGGQAIVDNKIQVYHCMQIAYNLVKMLSINCS